MSPPRQIRVIVGEDQASVREGIVHVLSDGGFDVVGTTADARDLVQMASACGPHVAVADIQAQLPATTGYLIEAVDVPLSSSLEPSDCDDLITATRRVAGRLTRGIR